MTKNLKSNSTSLDFHLLTKPSGAACNISCKYCFFLSKEHLYTEYESPLMDEDTLDAYIRQLIESSPSPEVQISWQGGKPMLWGLDFLAVGWTGKPLPQALLAHSAQHPNQWYLNWWQLDGVFQKTSLPGGSKYRWAAPIHARHLSYWK